MLYSVHYFLVKTKMTGFFQVGAFRVLTVSACSASSCVMESRDSGQARRPCCSPTNSSSPTTTNLRTLLPLLLLRPPQTAFYFGYTAMFCLGACFFEASRLARLLLWLPISAARRLWAASEPRSQELARSPSLPLQA